MKNKSIIKNDARPKQSREEYFAELRQSLEDMKNGRLICFTEAEFDTSINTLKKKEIE